MKIANIILAILFAVFAVVQINDPDPWLWVLYYGFVAAISAAAIFGKYNRWLLVLGILAGLIGTGLLLPEFIDWIQKGMPTITGSMKAESPHVEFTREFLGLFICMIVLIFHYFQMMKSKKHNL